MQVVKKKKNIELLAPAGNLDNALAAFSCGADAVYAGLAKFNARERADNFSVEEFAALTAHAAKSGKKVYAALNTLVKESELPEVMETLSTLAACAPDAVIVQDLGVLRMLREYFPQLRVHGSTQMGIHNSSGVALAAGLGVERVILERQLTLDELRVIMEKSPVEIEVFAHGALCCGLSGSCLFSSWLGGWSGNRGKCKQPCRRRYYSKDGNGFFFSPGDLAMLEKIPLLRELGVASLKIEGRLKSSDYVRNVVSAYRMVIDSPTPDEALIKQARNILSKSLGRKWTFGFSSEESCKSLVDHRSMGVSGQLCGKISGIGQGSFTVSLSKRLHTGDRIRIQSLSGDEGPAMTVLSMWVDGMRVNRAQRGQTCVIDGRLDMAPDSLVFKVGESQQGDKPLSIPIGSLRKSLDLEIALNSAGIRVGIANAMSGQSWTKELELAAAEKRGITADTVVEEFKTAKSERFSPGRINVEIEGKLFVPASILKQARREFWDWIEEGFDAGSLRDAGAEAMMRFHDNYRALRPAHIEDPREVIAVVPGGDRPGKRNIHIASPLYAMDKWADEAILPPFCSELRLRTISARIADLYTKGIRRFRATSLCHLEMLKDYSDIFIIASYPLPAANSMAVLELERLGVKRTQAWLELERKEMEAMAGKSRTEVEIYRHGRPALLSTRAEIPVSGRINDQRGNEFDIIKDHDRITRVYAASIMSIPRIPGTADFYDLSNARWNEREMSEFNFNQSWL